MIPKLTDEGKNLLMRALTGETINFTKIQIGNGPSQDPTQATVLANPLLTVNFTEITAGDEYVTLAATFTNGTVTSGFHITEAGFFAEDPDNAGAEILYAIGNEEESSADYVPSNSNRILEMQIEALIFIGDAENVTAAIGSSLVYATATELSAHTDDVSNPHQVTAQQIGLGNVPNVSTNNQTPTYTDATTLTPLSSGEKVSAAFAKIKVAITNLISHLNNRNNPHGITASQVGAAATSHTHSTTDINSGVLSVLRGGTGCTNADQLVSLISSLTVFPQLITGCYTGDGYSGPVVPENCLHFNAKPKFLYIQGQDGSAPLVIIDGHAREEIFVFWDPVAYDLTWHSLQAGAPETQCNKDGIIYFYIALL